MKTFFVGQRVRIVRVSDPANSSYIGRHGFIENIMVYEAWPDPLYGLDIVPIVFRDGQEGMGWYGIMSYQIEPILPEGHKASNLTYQQLMDSLKEKVA